MNFSAASRLGVITWLLTSLAIGSSSVRAEKADVSSLAQQQLSASAAIDVQEGTSAIAPSRTYPLLSLLRRKFASDDNSRSEAKSQSSANCARPDDNTLRAIVPVSTNTGNYASGVVVDNSRVLTAAHVVQGGEQFFVRVGETLRIADLIVVDYVNDLAVLAVDTQSIVPLQISGFDPARYQTVWAVGYPRAKAIMTSTGILQETRAGALYASASIDSGQSGGGLLSCQNGAWQMMGMLRGYGAYLQGDRYVKLPNHSVSVAAATINKFLQNYY